MNIGHDGLRILITGTQGFIANSLFEYFTAQGIETWGTVRRRRPRPREIKCDIRDAGFMEALPDLDFDIIIHAIAIVDLGAPRKNHFAVNAEGTKTMLAAGALSRCSMIKISI